MARARKHNYTQKEEEKPTLLPNTSPQFFKVFLKQLSSRRLRIPPVYVEQFDGTIPKKAFLKDMEGRHSPVELEWVEDGLFVDSGWEGFVNDHSIEHGDFLILKYRGESVFDVKIFGTNGCIKEAAVVNGEPTPKVEEEAEEAEQPPKVSNVGHQYGITGLGKYIMGKNGSMRSEVRKLFASNGLKLPKNPYFVGCLTRRYHLDLPMLVIRKHGIILKKEIVIRKQNGETWPVNVCSRKDGRIAVGSGWMNFLKSNKLGQKDRCVLEFLVGKGGICEELLAHIFQAGIKNGRGRRHSASLE